MKRMIKVCLLVTIVFGVGACRGNRGQKVMNAVKKVAPYSDDIYKATSKIKKCTVCDGDGILNNGKTCILCSGTGYKTIK